MRAFTASTLAVLALVACHREPTPEPGAEPAGPVVARFGEMTLTAGELDDHVLALPAAERPKPGEDLDAWYEEQIRRIVVERHLYREAEAAGLADDPALRAARAESEKQLTVGLCTSRRMEAAGRIGEAELRAAYEEHAARFSLPERRSAYNLFLRYETDGDRRAVRAEIESLRQRVLQGESFRRLASRHSDSESRHREGYFGWVTPGQLPEALDEVIFALDEGVPSEPVATRDGLHLFYVDQVLPAHRLSFEEALPTLREYLAAERRETTVRDMVAEIPVPSDSLVLDREAFAAVAQAGDLEAEVLRLGDYRLTLGGVRDQLRQVLAQQPANERPQASLELLWQQLEHLRRRELLYRGCTADGEVPEEQLRERLADWQRQAMVSRQRQQRLVDLAERDGERLRLFYDNNIGRFSEPPRWKIRLLEAPFGERPAARMAALEAARTSGATLEALQGRLGGEIETFDYQTLAEIARTRPKLPGLIAGVEPPGLTAPYRTDGGLEIAQVEARRDGDPEPFDEIRSKVAAAYVAHYTQDVYARLSDEILATAELRISPEGLQAARAASLEGRTGPGAATDVSVEELERLLEER